VDEVFHILGRVLLEHEIEVWLFAKAYERWGLSRLHSKGDLSQGVIIQALQTYIHPQCR
jgi:hypothetical protein